MGTLRLKQIAQESLTVSTVEKTITASKLSSNDIIYGLFCHVSGGKIFHTSLAVPTAGGTNGEIPQKVDDKWEIWGKDELEAWGAIRQTGEADAVINVTLYGT